jgi:hypothetical protein
LALRWCGLVSARGQGACPLPLYPAGPSYSAPATHSSGAISMSIALPMLFIAFILCVSGVVAYESWQYVELK